MPTTARLDPTPQLLGYRRVVVPTDGGSERTNAISVGLDVARRLQLPMELTWVVDERMADDDQFELAYWARALGQDVTARTIVGDSALQELAQIVSDPANLLCLPSHGRSALAELMLGSLSSQVLTTAQRPVLVVGPRCRPQLHGTHVAIAVDDTTGSESIIDDAHRLAVSLDLTARLVHVATDFDRYDAIQSRLLGLKASHLLRGGQPLEVAVRIDADVHAALEQVVADDDVAMFALASHGADARHRLLHSATAHQLIRHAYCPVLVSHR